MLSESRTASQQTIKGNEKQEADKKSVYAADQQSAGAKESAGVFLGKNAVLKLADNDL